MLFINSGFSKKVLPVLLLALSLSACSKNTLEQTKATDVAKDAAAAVKFDLPAGVKLIEKVSRSGDEIIIPYEKYQLDNGLTVILHEDNSDPLVHVDVTYHVGSGREEIGKSGFAHFFEHMQFQGSENVA